MMTDPIADMLTRIRNGNMKKREMVSIPASNMKKSLAQILLDEGYIRGYDYEEDDKQGVLKIDLKYVDDQRSISGIQRISKPGRRVYVRAKEVPYVLGGLGIAILSTSHGIMTDKQARAEGVGGEVICYVW